MSAAAPPPQHGSKQTAVRAWLESDSSPPTARSNGGGNSARREARSNLEADDQPSPTHVTLSLSMANQLKEDFARELRKIVREELWCPLGEASAVQAAPATQEGAVPVPARAELQAEPRMSVGQSTAMAFNEKLKKQGPPEASAPTTPRSGERAVPSAQDSAEAPPARGIGENAARVRAAGAQASGEARAAGPSDKANAGSPEELIDMDIDDVTLQAIRHLGQRMSCEPKTEANGSSSEAWTLVLDSMPCCRSCLVKIRGAYCLLGNVEAPPRSDPLSKLVDSKLFATLVHIIILLNGVFMIYAADQELLHYDGDKSVLVEIGELFFLIAYSIEFVAKMWRYHWCYFCGSGWKMNCVDFFLLLLVAWSILLDDVFPNYSSLRTLRMLRLFKVVRVLRLISVAKPMRAILKSLFDTLGTLFWSVTLLVLILALFALVLVMRVTSYLKDEGDSLDEDVKEALLSAYGGVSLTFHHLFIVTTNGNNWTYYYHPLIATGVVNCGIFYFFVLFTQISVLNVILGVFVDTALKSMVPDRDERIQTHADSQKQMLDNLMELCVEADTDNDGRLSEAEWQAVMRNDKLTKYLELMEWRPGEVADFLDLMRKGTADGEIEIDVFVRACMRFRGTASCYDMQIVLSAVEDLRRHIRTGARGRAAESSPGASSPLRDGDREPPSGPGVSPLGRGEGDSSRERPASRS